MKNTFALAARIREVILDGTWIANTNYKQQLIGMDWRTATAKQETLNTIADLSQHIHYYIKSVKQVFEEGKLTIKDQYSFDFPPILSQEAWEAFLNQFWNDTEALALLIQNMPEEKLQAIFVDEKYGTYQRNIDGIIEHSYYHLGQIVLLKKLAAKSY